MWKRTRALRLSTLVLLSRPSPHISQPSGGQQANSRIGVGSRKAPGSSRALCLCRSMNEAVRYRSVLPWSASPYSSRENLRRATQRAMSREKTIAEQRWPKVAPKGTEHPAHLEPAAACRPARTPRRPPTRAAPPQRHGRRRMAAARLGAAAQERRRAPGATLRRQLPH